MSPYAVELDARREVYAILKPFPSDIREKILLDIKDRLTRERAEERGGEVSALDKMPL